MHVIPQDPQACSPFYMSILVVPPVRDALTHIPPCGHHLLGVRSMPPFAPSHLFVSKPIRSDFLESPRPLHGIFELVNISAFLLPFLSNNCRSTPSFSGTHSVLGAHHNMTEASLCMFAPLLFFASRLLLPVLLRSLSWLSSMQWNSPFTCPASFPGIMSVRPVLS